MFATGYYNVKRKDEFGNKKEKSEKWNFLKILKNR